MKTKWKRRTRTVAAEPAPIRTGRAMVDQPRLFTEDDARRCRSKLIDSTRYDQANREQFGWDWTDMVRHDGWKLLGFGSAEEFQRTSRPEGLGATPLQALVMTLPRHMHSPKIDKCQLISDLINELRRIQSADDMPF